MEVQYVLQCFYVQCIMSCCYDPQAAEKESYIKFVYVQLCDAARDMEEDEVRGGVGAGLGVGAWRGGVGAGNEAVVRGWVGLGGGSGSVGPGSGDAAKGGDRMRCVAGWGLLGLG